MMKTDDLSCDDVFHHQTTKSFPFMLLPADIRIMIYDIIFAKDEDLGVTIRHANSIPSDYNPSSLNRDITSSMPERNPVPNLPHENCMKKPPPLMNHLPDLGTTVSFSSMNFSANVSLLRANAQLYREAIPYLYANVTFLFNDWDLLNPFIGRMSVQARRCLTRIRLSIPLAGSRRQEASEYRWYPWLAGSINSHNPQDEFFPWYWLSGDDERDWRNLCMQIAQWLPNVENLLIDWDEPGDYWSEWEASDPTNWVRDNRKSFSDEESRSFENAVLVPLLAPLANLEMEHGIEIQHLLGVRSPSFVRNMIESLWREQLHICKR